MAKLDYRHIDKDPEIDMIRTECQRRGGVGNKIPDAFLERVANDSGVSIYTIKNWLFGDTRRPHNLTMRFVWEALGCRKQIVRDDGTVIRGMNNA